MPIDPELPTDGIGGPEHPQQPGETVGPEQFYGLDEPGPDFNRHADFFEQQNGSEPTGKDDSQRVDPEKAREMALAGDDHRSKAASHRLAAKSPFHGGIGSEGEFFHSGRAEIEDKSASKLEEEAGRQYDAEHPSDGEDEPQATQPVPFEGNEAHSADGPETVQELGSTAPGEETLDPDKSKVEHGTASRETLLAHQEDLFQQLQVLSENLRETLGELKETTRKLSGHEGSTKSDTPQSETTDSPEQSKDDWQEQQRRAWSN
jgi:hypothetical protein